MRARARMLVCAAVLSPALVVSSATAHTAERLHNVDEVLVSADGRTWSAELPRPVFDPAHRWVPGERRTSAFWVRNHGDTAGSLTLSALVDDHGRLAADGAVRVEVRRGEDGWAWLAPGRTDVALGELPQGQQDRIEVRAAFASDAGNDTRRRGLDLDFQVTLRRDRPSDRETAATPRSEPDDGSLLPDTGAPAVGWLLAVAAGLLGAGVALVARRRDDRS